MKQLLVTPRARQDAQAILRYYRQQAGSEVWFRNALDTGVMHILRWPDSGHLQMEFDDRMRFWLVKPHYLVYRTQGNSLYLLAVIHSSRDLTAVLRSRL